MKKRIVLYGVAGITIFYGCKDSSNNRQSNESIESPPIESVHSQPNIEKVNFYIENSGSIAPYVQQVDSEFKTTLIDLAESPIFENFSKSYYFIDGINTTEIGETVFQLEESLVPENFKARTSDLTKIFTQALDSLENQISIVVTDALYDISNKNEGCKIEKPDERLRRETTHLETEIKRKIERSYFQTTLLKAVSSFQGRYWYASKPEVCSIVLDQNRPYYIFIFGPPEVFNNEFVKNHLADVNHVVEIASFHKAQQKSIPYETLEYHRSNETRGNYRLCRYENRSHCLERIKGELRTNGFDFVFETDLSDYPWYYSMAETIENYKTNNENYIVSEVVRINRNSSTHRIKVSVDTGAFFDNDLEVYLVDCQLQSWLNETNTNEEINVVGNESQTWGFQFIVDAFVDSYCPPLTQNKLANFKFQISL